MNKTNFKSKLLVLMALCLQAQMAFAAPSKAPEVVEQLENALKTTLMEVGGEEIRIIGYQTTLSRFSNDAFRGDSQAIGERRANTNLLRTACMDYRSLYYRVKANVDELRANDPGRARPDILSERERFYTENCLGLTEDL